jgi:glycosyltransferase involved in cell wall biosynthesis
MKYIVAGTARNITKTWEIAKVSLSHIFKAIEEYTCIIIESNSDDNSLQLLQDWASEDSRRTVISLGTLIGSRTQRIAKCRNEYLKYITNEDFLIVVDLDDVLQIQENFKEQLDSCFVRNQWDAIGSNRLEKYYDIWALRSQQLGVTFDCWEEARKYSKKKITLKGFIMIFDRQTYVDKYQINIPITSDWIECQSAFCGMVLYKVQSIKGRKYDGDITCEHINFNKGLQMFINPKFISG